jgi:hypothetical protein
MPQTSITPFSAACISCQHFDPSREVCTRKTHYEFHADLALTVCNEASATDPACHLYKATRLELPCLGIRQTAVVA